MTENKKNIFFFAVISFIFLILAYFSTWLPENAKLLEKDFFLALSSGIFASSCVVLFSEIVKYNLNKKNIQNALYENLRELYRQFISHKKYVQFLINNPQKEVAENTFSANAPMINNLAYAIRFLQYDTFLKNHFSYELFYFQQNEMSLLDNYTSACMTFLQIAIVKTRLEKAESYQVNEAGARISYL